jgi:hypothetical protein
MGTACGLKDWLCASNSSDFVGISLKIVWWMKLERRGHADMSGFLLKIGGRTGSEGIGGWDHPGRHVCLLNQPLALPWHASFIFSKHMFRTGKANF